MKNRPVPSWQTLLILILSTISLSAVGPHSSAYGDSSLSFYSLPARYLNLYLLNPRAFAPYSRKKRLSVKKEAVLLYHHLCQGHEFKGECQKHKKKLVSFFKSQLTQIVQADGLTVELESELEYLDQLNQTVKRLQDAYRNTRKSVDQELGRALLFIPNLEPSSTEEFNQSVEAAFQQDPLCTQLEAYRKTYWTATQEYRGKILLSKTFHGRIEGGFFNVVFNDIMLAIDELTRQARIEFGKILMHPPEGEDFLDEGAAREIVQQAAELLEQDLKKDWDRSNHLIPHKATPEAFALIQYYHSNDIEVVRLLAQNQLQRAIWRLSEIGQFEKAEQLERYLSTAVMTPENVAEISKLGGGYTTTQLVRFKEGTQGVSKPKPWSQKNGSVGFFQNLKDTVASHYKKEIAAYRINSNKMIGLNLVPLTESRMIEGSVGSLQNYVSDATQARLMREVKIGNPKKAGIWTSQDTRTRVSKNILLFDWLTGNPDRNLDNYLLADDGKIVLIDHSWSFLNLFYFKPSPSHIKAMFPSEAVFTNMDKLNLHPEIIDEQLKDFISGHQIKILKKKIKFIVDYVNQRIQLEGRERVFPALTPSSK